MDQQAKKLANLRSAAIDGRTHNPFFRKTQLENLHKALVRDAAKIQDTMREDKSLMSTDIKIEYSLALQCVVKAYDQIEPIKDLENEYAVAQGCNSPNARHPVGLVIIEPSTRVFFYGLLAAVIPALSAGNGIIVQVGRSRTGSPCGMTLICFTDWQLIKGATSTSLGPYTRGLG